MAISGQSRGQIDQSVLPLPPSPWGNPPQRGSGRLRDCRGGLRPTPQRGFRQGGIECCNCNRNNFKPEEECLQRCTHVNDETTSDYLSHEEKEEEGEEEARPDQGKQFKGKKKGKTTKGYFAKELDCQPNPALCTCSDQHCSYIFSKHFHGNRVAGDKFRYRKNCEYCLVSLLIVR